MRRGACLLTLTAASVAAAAGCGRPAATTGTAAPKHRLKPFPAGSLYSERVTYEFAVYYAPRPRHDPRRTLDALLAAEFKGLARRAELGEAGPWPALSVREPRVSEYAPPSVDSLSSFGRGLGPKQIEAVQGAERVVVLRFGAEGDTRLPALREAGHLVGALAKRTSGLVWDEETRELFSPEAWEERRVRDFATGVPHVPAHTVIHQYANGELNRAITLGMGKFGLPDVVANDFPRSYARSIGNLINLVCQTLAEKGRLEKAGRLTVDLETLGDPELRETLKASLEAEAQGKAELAVAVGTSEEGDPQNRLLELTFEESPGASGPERQSALLDRIFGSTDSITHTTHDDELLAASARAKAQLPSLKRHFAKGLSPRERLLVKGPFKTRDGGNEWMWVEVTRWTDRTIGGILQNEPFEVDGLRAGASVEVAEDDVFDYLHAQADGSQKGNETGEVIQRREASPASPKKAFGPAPRTPPPR